mmetsp:Transcript_18902/g.38793  ORF Transcript_18902/g.38793 Transcript_18902/m.38793 type:complete len:237 (-) Transcript_18902:140-850(-)|eukprot:CAMPEP_0171390958 /NCGR_PEP_ID=MMETSP0880-20121228/929_1 /TAXON_ID=67004 /ORGANISM="Thalassiosira weissflogii, Strain CCMP1336" /LENGTH=236 /DNA_ID=CAMNT_0011903491 /DNA_START=49 /DNA_END=759 /DNA_ORIENTATION=+
MNKAPKPTNSIALAPLQSQSEGNKMVKSKHHDASHCHSPKSMVPPGHGDPVEKPSEYDVLSGRGGAINMHKGNIRLRHLVNLAKYEYLSPTTRKLQKSRIAARIVWAIRSFDPPGRFLKENKTSGMWEEIGDAAAYRKVSQALRENSSEFRSCHEYKASGGDVNIDADAGSSPRSVKISSGFGNYLVGGPRGHDDVVRSYWGANRNNLLGIPFHGASMSQMPGNKPPFFTQHKMPL